MGNIPNLTNTENTLTTKHYDDCDDITADYQKEREETLLNA